MIAFIHVKSIHPSLRTKVALRWDSEVKPSGPGHCSNSSIGTSSASLPTMAFATLQTWIRLSSAALHSTHGSFMFQLKSEIRLVWPPCMNNLVSDLSVQSFLISQKETHNSGGPSSASSGVCSSPTRLRSQKLMRRS